MNDIPDGGGIHLPPSGELLTLVNNSKNELYVRILSKNAPKEIDGWPQKERILLSTQGHKGTKIISLGGKKISLLL